MISVFSLLVGVYHGSHIIMCGGRPRHCRSVLYAAQKSFVFQVSRIILGGLDAKLTRLGSMNRVINTIVLYTLENNALTRCVKLNLSMIVYSCIVYYA